MGWSGVVWAEGMGIWGGLWMSCLTFTVSATRIFTNKTFFSIQPLRNQD